MRVTYSKHIEDKLNKELTRLKITKELLEKVVFEPDEVLSDVENDRNIALSL